MNQLKRSQVLRTGSEISTVLKSTNVKSKHLLFCFKENLSGDFSRIGLAIPKKMAKRAVDRNKIKRMVRERFRNSSNSAALDIVVKLNNRVGKNTKLKLRQKERVEIRSQIEKYFDRV